MISDANALPVAPVRATPRNTPGVPLALTDRRVTSVRLLRLVTRLPSLALVGLIRIYQRTLSPALPVLTMGRCGCRFSPTCSHYAAEAIRTHGALAGFALAAARLVKCTPLHPGGFDPVPPRTPRCERTTALSSSL